MQKLTLISTIVVSAISFMACQNITDNSVDSNTNATAQTKQDMLTYTLVINNKEIKSELYPSFSAGDLYRNHFPMSYEFTKEGNFLQAKIEFPFISDRMMRYHQVQKGDVLIDLGSSTLMIALDDETKTRENVLLLSKVATENLDLLNSDKVQITFKK